MITIPKFKFYIFALIIEWILFFFIGMNLISRRMDFIFLFFMLAYPVFFIAGYKTLTQITIDKMKIILAPKFEKFITDKLKINIIKTESEKEERFAEAFFILTFFLFIVGFLMAL